MRSPIPQVDPRCGIFITRTVESVALTRGPLSFPLAFD
jgi:hypothetical protein